MAGADSVALAWSVSATGALGSLACALRSPEAIREAVRVFGKETDRPINLNFFCDTMETPHEAAVEKWKKLLSFHYERSGLDIEAVVETGLRQPFNEEMCDLVEELKPEIVSFHFGLPAVALVGRLKNLGVTILSSATSVGEAIWLEDHGCDAVIVQGLEAGGHRAMFLETDVTTQVGLFALLPRVADAVSIPLIAAGGIADARGIVAAFALGACGVQMGTAFLFCPEANVSPLHRLALEQVSDTGTAITNLFSGRPARGILNRYIRESGPMSEDALSFPYAATLVAPLRAAAEKANSLDYMQMWAGQAARPLRTMPAGQLAQKLAADALSRFGAYS